VFIFQQFLSRGNFHKTLGKEDAHSNTKDPGAGFAQNIKGRLPTKDKTL